MLSAPKYFCFRCWSSGAEASARAEALAVAGGTTTSTAKTQIFLFHKTSNGMFEVKKVNLKPLFQGKDVTENATLQPGDMVYVPEKFIANFRKYVPYSISAGSFLQQGLP